MKDPSTSKGKEYLLVALWAALFLALCAWPYLWTAGHAPQGTVFSGFLMNEMDQHVYLSWMKQAEHGLWIENQFTTEPQTARMFLPVFWAWGKFSALAQLPLLVSYQAVHALAAIFFILALWVLSRQYFDTARKRLFFVVWVSLASGLSWLLPESWARTVPWLADAYDVNVPEAIPFLAVMGNAVFALSMVLIVVCAVYLPRLFEPQVSIRDKVLAAGACFLLGMVHYYDVLNLLLGAVLLALWSWWARDEGTESAFLKSFWFVLPAIASLGLMLAWTRGSSVMSLHLAQGATWSYALPALLTGWGLTFLLAVPRFFGRSLSAVSVRERWLVCWILAGFLNMYNPLFFFQRKCSAGLMIPLALLAMLFLYDRLRGLSKIRSGAVLGLLLLIVVPGGILTEGTVARFAVQNPLSHFQSRQDTAALAWLGQQGRSDDAVFASPYIGMLVPEQTGMRTFVGSWVHTVDYEAKRKFFWACYGKEMRDKDRRNILNTFRVTYVYHGPIEQAAGPWQPDRAGWLKKVYDTDGVRIYKVSR